MTTDSVLYLLPEATLAGVATLIVVLGVFVAWRAVWSWVAAAGLVLAAVLVLRFDGVADGGLLAGDAMANFVRWLVVGSGLLLVMAAARASCRTQTAEYVGSLLFAVLGLLLVASAQDLTLMFVGLELVSIPSYILLYLGGRGVPGKEATAKYFFLSVFSSAVTLYGFAFLYGIGGSTHLVEIHARLIDGVPSGFQLLGALALVLIFSGLAFKIAAAPFHFYAPDVYQGTSPINAAILAVLPKIAGIVAMVRILGVAMPGQSETGWHLALVIAALTMTLGNTLALWQNNVRRLLAYSSIAHAGYMLIGLTVAFAAQETVDTVSQFDGLAAMLFYLAVYALATIGVFAALTYLGDDQRPLETVDEMAGLGRSRPITALAIAVFMFSLAGVPPLAGFWGKLGLFASAIAFQPGQAGGAQGWLLVLAIVGLLNAVVAAGYYLRIVAVMYFRSSDRPAAGEGGAGAWTASFICALLVLAVGLLPGPMVNASRQAATAARTSVQQDAVERAADVAAGSVSFSQTAAMNEPF